VISFAMALVISVGVYLFLKLSRLGKAVRATALNAEVAMVCGINVRRIYLVTTGLAAALAVAGGALVSIQFGFMLAILENLVSLMVPNGTAMVELAAYGLMIFVLLIRPGGLMGVKEA
jgi:branched-chain amino acid transport system permease protein